MKRVFSRITAAFLVGGAFLGCSVPPDNASEPGSIRVLAPMNNASGSYSLDVIELKGIDDVNSLSGRFVRFFTSPRITNDRLQGPAPKAHFIRNKSGDYIPANEATQQLVAVYAHMQKLAALDEELGAGGVNKWPRDIGVAVRVKGGLDNNAFYDGKTDSMLFVPYVNQSLPIAVNGGILAHEHFHSLFYKLVVGDSAAQVHDRREFFESTNIVENSSDILETKMNMQGMEIDLLAPAQMHYYYHLMLKRSLNEGLADFWGWMYTGNPDFIAQSLPGPGVARSLKVSDENLAKVLPSEGEVKQEVMNIYQKTFDKTYFESNLNNKAYFFATKFSRAIKQFTETFAKAHDIESLQARKEVAKILIKTLPQVRKQFEELGDKYYSSADFVMAFASQIPEMKQSECDFWVDVLVNSGDANGFDYICNEETDMKIVKKAREKTKVVTELPTPIRSPENPFPVRTK